MRETIEASVLLFIFPDSASGRQIECALNILNIAVTPLF
jgi:hypothetical protein